jgi:hypothetical protein
MQTGMHPVALSRAVGNALRFPVLRSGALTATLPDNGRKPIAEIWLEGNRHKLVLKSDLQLL